MNVGLALYWLKINRMCKRIQADPEAISYSDLAMAPVCDDDEKKLEIFGGSSLNRHRSRGGRIAQAEIDVTPHHHAQR